MGKISDGLRSINEGLTQLEVAISSYENKLANICKSGDSWLKSGTKGVDELFLYLSEKLKKTISITMMFCKIH